MRWGFGVRPVIYVLSIISELPVSGGATILEQVGPAVGPKVVR